MFHRLSLPRDTKYLTMSLNLVVGECTSSAFSPRISIIHFWQTNMLQENRNKLGWDELGMRQEGLNEFG